MGSPSDKPEPLFLFPPDAAQTPNGLSAAPSAANTSTAPILPSADRQITRDEAAVIAARVYALVRSCPSGRVGKVPASASAAGTLCVDADADVSSRSASASSQ